jgi:hypothetical protein
MFVKLAIGLAVVTVFSTTAPDTAATNTMADQWVAHRTEPLWQQQAEEQKKKKHPVRKIIKAVGENYAHAFHEMGKDMAFVFSSDFDPYDKEKAPVDKPAIILEMNLVDGSTAYLWRFPDNSFAVQGGFADNTVIDPLEDKPNEYLVKYPNGAKGRIVRTGSTTKIYRPDDSVTTIEKTPRGDYRMNNDKIGFMGEAHTDPTGLQYELGTWTKGKDGDLMQ